MIISRSHQIPCLARLIRGSRGNKRLANHCLYVFILRFQYLIFQGRQLFAHRILMQQCVHLRFPRPAGRHAKSVIDWPASSDESSLTSLFVAFARTKSRDIVSNRVCAIQFHSTGPSYRGRSGSGRLERKLFFRNFILSLQFLYWSIRC